MEKRPQIINITKILRKEKMLLVKRGRAEILDRKEYLEELNEKFDRFAYELGKSNKGVQKYDIKKTPSYRYLVAKLPDYD